MTLVSIDYNQYAVFGTLDAEEIKALTRLRSVVKTLDNGTVVVRGPKVSIEVKTVDIVDESEMNQEQLVAEANRNAEQYKNWYYEEMGKANDLKKKLDALTVALQGGPETAKPTQ